MSLTIGFDAKRALFNSTGLGNYSRNVIMALQEFYPENRYVLFSPALRRDVKEFKIDPEHTSVVFSPSTRFGALWRSYGITRVSDFASLDIYHGLSGELPFGTYNVPSVVTIHDLIFLQHPQLYTFADRNFYNIKMKYAAQRADRIIAISQATKQDIVKFYGVNPEKISVVYQACHTSFMNKVDESKLTEVREKYSLPEQYILNVATIEARKNVLSVLKAIHEYGIDYPLVIAGKKKDYFYREVQPYIERNKLRNVYLIEPDFADLPAIYQSATIFVYPSLYEGFGLPVIEAQYSGVPVITSNVSSMPEAAGPHSILISPTDVDQLAVAITDLLNNSSLRKKITDEGLRFVKRFNEENFAKQILEVYQQVLG